MNSFIHYLFICMFYMVRKIFIGGLSYSTDDGEFEFLVLYIIFSFQFKSIQMIELKYSCCFVTVTMTINVLLL